MSERKGEWFQLQSGKAFWPFDPRPEDFQINDIAHSLSLVCRFGGHCKQFYSVAQHSVIVSQIVPDEHRLEGLMHDACEAYLGDMVKPLKIGMHDFEKLEDSLYEIIAEKYGFPKHKTDPVRYADGVLLATEARDLMTPSDVIWGKWINQFKPLERKIYPCSPINAEVGFINFFHQYTHGKFA